MKVSLLATLASLGLLSGCVFYIGEDGSGLRTWDGFDGPGWLGGGSRVVGSGVILEEERSLPSFEEITVAGAFEVEVRVEVGPSSVTLEGDDNLLPLVRTEVDDGELEVRFQKHTSISTSERMIVRIQTSSVEGLTLAGSSKATLDGVYADSLELSIAGSGEIRASGAVDELQVSIAGSGEVDTMDLSAREAEVFIAGSGDVSLAVDASLEARIAGSGNIQYLGDPDTELSVSGSGDIERVR